MKRNDFIFKYNDIILNINEGSFISIVGNNNIDIYNTFLNNKKINSISYKDLSNDYNSISDKVKSKIMNSLKSKKILVINNILNLLDINDYKSVLKVLKSYSLKGHIIINLTNVSEETLFSDRMIVIYNKKILFDDEALNVLNNEKIMKRIGIGLPFIVELNKYLMDYNLIDSYYLSNKKLVGALWK